MDQRSTLAENLRVLRAKQNLNIKDAASKIGITRETLRDLENGTRDPYPPTLARIAAGYNISVRDLLSPAEVEKKEPALVGKGEAPEESGPTSEPKVVTGEAHIKAGVTVRVEGLVRTYKTVARIGRKVARSFTNFKETDLERLADFHALSTGLAALRKRDILGRDPEDLADAVEELDEAQDAVQVALQEHLDLAQPEKRPLLQRAAELVGAW